MTRDYPHDHDAEDALLGAAMLSDVAIETAGQIITADDFNKPGNGHIWHAICATYATGKVDAVAVAAQLQADGFKGDAYNLATLSKLTLNTPAVSNALRYARIVTEHATRARLWAAAAELIDRVQADPDAASLAEYARERFAGIDVPAGKPVPDPDFVSFMEAHAAEYDWIVPGVLEHRDRLLITAAEGAGKSILCAQIGVMTAAGLHCWTAKPIQPRNVAIIDLENSPRMLTRRLGMMRAAAIRCGATLDPQRLRVCARPEGLDLTTRTDRRWLLERCQANQTEMLVIGPAYRMSAGAAAKGDVGGEDQARTVTKALDEIRNRCNVTLIMETHAPHGGAFGRDLRPFGSSVWLRWPEFGLGIRRSGDSPDDYEVEHWRGPRDQRTWPSVLQRHRGHWPWTATLPIPTHRPTTPTEESPC